MEETGRSTLRLDDAAIDEILKRLDAHADNSRSSNARRSRRYSYRARSVLVQFQMQEESRRHAVPCRNLSRDGVAFLVRHFVYPGTACRVRLVSEFNYVVEVEGKVQRCRYVEGTAGVHEVGVSFNTPIDIALFHREATSVCVLLVDDDSVQLRLLERLLVRLGAAVQSCQNPQQTLAAAMARTYDLILVNSEATGFDGCELIRGLRAAGYVRQVMALTTSPSTTLAERCQKANCTACAPVALSTDELCNLILRLKNEPLLSSLVSDPEMAGTINQFVADLPARAAELEQAARAGDTAKQVGWLRRLAVFADECGFEIIADAARAYEASLEGQSAETERRERLNVLLQRCHAARPATVDVEARS